MPDTSADKKARILLVQDDPVILGSLSGTLRADGHEIIITSNPLDALSFPRHEYQSIDLVIIRINIKPITGLEFARRLTRRTIDVPVLFMSASHPLASVIGQSMGQSAVIEEPFTAAELRSAVKKCLSQRKRRSNQTSRAS